MSKRVGTGGASSSQTSTAAQPSALAKFEALVGRKDKCAPEVFYAWVETRKVFDRALEWADSYLGELDDEGARAVRRVIAEARNG